MKIIYTLILLLSATQLLAQKFNGLVFDKETKQPVYNANISMGLFKTVTSTDGKFTFNNVQQGDLLDISCVGYETYHLKVVVDHADPVIIWLSRTSVALQEFTVVGRRTGLRKDPPRPIMDFKAAVYQAPKPLVNKIFIFREASNRAKTFNGRDINSTSSLVSLNVLPLISLLSSGKKHLSRLDKNVIQKENEKYADQVFSRDRVVAITKLKADSLDNFMEQYRPSGADAKKMSDYEMITYIKKSYLEFRKAEHTIK
jgi:hypothetical protein